MSDDTKQANPADHTDPEGGPKKVRPRKRAKVSRQGAEKASRGSDAPARTSSAHPAAAEPAAQRPAKGGRALGAIALLVALAALGVSGYLWYQSQVTEKLENAQLSSTVATLDSRLNDIKDTQSGADQKLTQQQDAVNQTIQGLQTDMTGLQQQQSDLAASMAKVYAELDRSVDTWAIEEVEQLLLLANHRLRLAGDRDTALAALEIADQRLQDLGDPAFVETRALITDGVAKLQTIKPVDIPGLALRLSSAAKVVDRLALKTEPRLQASAPETQTSDTTGSGALANLARDVWQSLRTLVRIQDTREPRQPLLAPEQRYYLQENLRLQLLGAELALLRDAPQTYHDLLTQAITWTEEYFDNEDTAVVQFKNDLSSLLQANLESELPDISASVAALRAVKAAQTDR